MSSSALAAGLRHLRRQLASQQPNEESDEQLLYAFTGRRDDSAFAVLMRRHGPMVLHVCRRVLGHEQDAEDAFQATFLVLARNAASLRTKKSLASFLYGTAYRIAMKAKQAAARRRKHEGQAPSRAPADPAEDLSWREIQARIDEEIARLPEKYRSVFVLCCLENLSRAEAGQRLGLRERPVLSRLAEARKRLAQRLARRGVELTAVLAAVALATDPASALPAVLMATTIKAAMATAASEGLAGVVSTSVAELVQGMMAAMMASRARIATVVVVASLLAIATCGSLVCWYQQAKGPLAATPEPSNAKAVEKPKATPSHREPAKTREIQGRVLDPGGNPVKGAHLHWPRIRKVLPKGENRLETVEHGRSDDEGQFRIAVPDDENPHDSLHTLLVPASGFGVTWVDVPKAKSAEKVTVRMRKDAIIRGRILSTEGRPLGGVRVRVESLEEMTNGRLDEYLAFWEQDWDKALRLKTRWFELPSTQAVLPSAVTEPGSAGFLTLHNAVKRLGLAPDAGVVEQNLYLGRGGTAKVRIRDPQDKPLSGVIVSGIDAMPGYHVHEAYVAPEAECTIVALDPRQPRQVIFYHPKRRLAASLLVRGDEKEPFTVRLVPTGTVTGHIKDADGRPLQGAEMDAGANGPLLASNLGYFYAHLHNTVLPVRTDKDGRFQLEGVVPGEQFAVDIRHRGAYLDGGPRTRGLQVKSGETLDLGDIRIQTAKSARWGNVKSKETALPKSR